MIKIKKGDLVWVETPKWDHMSGFHHKAKLGMVVETAQTSTETYRLWEVLVDGQVKKVLRYQLKLAKPKDEQ